MEERNAIIQEIFDEDVSVNVHYKPLPLLSYYQSLGYQMSDFPVAKLMWENEISLPVFYDLTDEQINRVVEVVVKSVKKIIS